MTEDSVAQPTAEPRRKRARRWWLALGLVGLALAGWWFGVELPERRAAAEIKRQQAEKSFRIADLVLDMVWIPPGEFLMGTPVQSALAKRFYGFREKITQWPNPGDYLGTPVTRVTLTRPFWLGRTEVTQAQWQAIMGGNTSQFKSENLPVEMVTWDETMEFCHKLTERERAAGRLPKGYSYTLPTEAQWEYACRAGTTGNYAGNLDAMAWHRCNSGFTTHTVGMKRPNAWGLYDMHGNVEEWCTDWFDYDYRGGEVTNPMGPSSGLSSNPSRVFRGGSEGSDAAGCRSAFRLRHPPGVRSGGVGFRLALASNTMGSPTSAATAAKQ